MMLVDDVVAESAAIISVSSELCERLQRHTIIAFVCVVHTNNSHVIDVHPNLVQFPGITVRSTIINHAGSVLGFGFDLVSHMVIRSLSDKRIYYNRFYTH